MRPVFLSPAMMLGLLATNVFSGAEVSALLAPPLGRFSSTSQSGGGARLGFGMGAAYWREFTPSLSIGTEGFVIFNPLDHDAIEGQIRAASGASSVRLTGGNYFNLPFFISAAYRFPIQKEFAFILQAGAGADFLSITDSRADVDGDVTTGTFSCDPALAFSVGERMEMGRYFIAFRYMNLGDHQATVASSSQGGNTITAFRQKEALLVIQAGLGF